MKSRLLTLIAATILMAVAVIGLITLFSPCELDDVRCLIPANPTIYVEINEAGKRWTRFIGSPDFRKFTKTRFNKYLKTESELKSFFEKFSEMDGKLWPLINKTSSAVFGRQACVCFVTGKDGDVQAALYSKVVPSIVGYESLYRNFFGWWGKNKISVESYRGYFLRYIANENDENKTGIYYVLIGDALVASPGDELPRSAIDLYLDGSEKSLLYDNKTLQTMKKNSRDSVVSAYIDPVRIGNLADAAVKTNRMTRKSADDLLGYVQPLAKNMRADGISLGLWFDGAAHVDVWFGGKPLRSIEKQAPNPRYINFLSGDTCAFVDFPLDLYAFFQELERMGVSGAKDFNTEFDALGKLFDINFKRFVKDNFTERTAMVVRDQRDAPDSPGGNPAFAILLECRDRDDFSKNLRKIVSVLAEKNRRGLVTFELMRPFVANGQRFYIYRIGALDKTRDLVISSAFSPSFALIGDYFIFSSRYENLIAFAKSYSDVSTPQISGDSPSEEFISLAELDSYRSIRKKLMLTSRPAAFMKAGVARLCYQSVLMDKIELDRNLAPDEKEKARNEVIESMKKLQFLRYGGVTADYLRDGVKFHFVFSLAQDHPVKNDMKNRKNP